MAAVVLTALVALTAVVALMAVVLTSAGTGEVVALDVSMVRGLTMLLASPEASAVC